MSRKSRWIVRATLLLVLLSIALPLYAAYWLQRPIIYDGGRIRQGRVWGVESHHGVDFSYGFGTYVYAIADGTVVQVVENVENNTWPPDNNWGNFVLVRHNGLFWDRTTQQNAYVYSIYAHLKQWSVRPSVGQFVGAGTWIAEVDNTGHSTGHHLHLQICLHPQPDRLLRPNTLNSENTSRNPELWLQPFNYGGTNTGTVVGKLTDNNGQPVGDRYIWGLSKPPGSGGTTYTKSRTYAHTWTNPDDILVENWAATDVLPGTYHLTVRDESGSYIYEDLGWHTVGADETTYVGLYPVYLPDIMENYYGWNSSIVVRNNSDSKTAQVNTTFFWEDSSVETQATDYIAPRGTVVVDFPGPCSYCRGSALVAASEDVSVVVENQSSGTSRSYAYNGIAASDPLNPDWGQMGTTLYAPVIMYNYWGWYSGLVLLNAGSATANGNVEYYRSSDGQKVHTDPFSLPPNGSLQAIYSGGAADTLYSARIVSDQPLAAVGVQHKWDATVYSAYNCLSAGASPVYAPVIVNNYYGWDTSVNIQNTGDSTATVYVRYYNTSGNQVGPLHVDSIPPYASRSRYSASPEEELPDNFVGTARIYSYQQPLAVVVNQSSPRGGSTTRGQSYNGTSSGSTYVVLPDVLNYYGDENWVSSVNVRNLSTIYSTDVTLTYQGWSVTRTINRKGFFSFYVPIYWGTDSLRGPATVSSDSQPVAVVVNHASVDQTGVDLARSLQWLQPIACHCAVERSKRPADDPPAFFFVATDVPSCPW